MGKTEGKKNRKTVKRAGSNKPKNAVSTLNTIEYPVQNIQKSPSTTPKNKNKLKNQSTTSKNTKKSRKTIRKQRNKRIIATVILVSILLFICIFISLKVLFVVRDVEVVGSEKYSQDEILAYCVIPLEQNIFEVDTEVFEKNLPSEFTYIENAKVQRKLPDKILITITDSIPTYYTEIVEDEISTYVIYSQNFKRLVEQSAAPDGLVNISADLENEENKNLILQVIDKLEKHEYDKVTGIIISEKNDVSIIYDGRIEVKLGTMLDIEYKLKMSYHILRNELSDTDRGVVDATQAGSAIFKPVF